MNATALVTPTGSSVKANNQKLRPAEGYHDELMQIYLWPFIVVVTYTCIGTLGNAVCLYIYTFRWKRTKARIFLIMLAVLNFVNSIFNMPIEAYILWHPLQFDNHWLCKITRGVTFVINNVCACVFVAIAVDRILLVYRPLKRQVLTSRYAKISCAIAFVIGFVTSWPGFVFYGTATLPEKLDDVIVIGKTCHLSDEFREKKRLPSIFNTVLFVLMLTVFLILIILYIIIGRKIYNVTKRDITDSKLKKTQISKNPKILVSIRTLAVKSVLPEQRFSDTKEEEDLNENESLRNTQMSIEDKLKKQKRMSLSETRNRPRMSRRISNVNADAARGNTITMLMITIAFVVCFLPYLVIVSLRYINEELYFNLPKSNRVAYHIFLRTYFFNSVVNPIIYSFVNKEFRNLVLGMFRTFVKKVKNCRG